jgi:hypothetical protein
VLLGITADSSISQTASQTTWSANVVWVVWRTLPECSLFKLLISFVCLFGQIFFIVTYVTFYKISPIKMFKMTVDVWRACWAQYSRGDVATRTAPQNKCGLLHGCLFTVGVKLNIHYLTCTEREPGWLDTPIEMFVAFVNLPAIASYNTLIQAWAASCFPSTAHSTVY